MVMLREQGKQAEGNERERGIQEERAREGNKREPEVQEKNTWRKKISHVFQKKWFNRDNLIILILLGILLFIIALPTKEDSQGTGELTGAGGLEELFYDPAQSVSAENGIVVETAGKAGEDGVTSALEEYALLQEAKLKTLLSSVEGVGKVEVMLTFLSSEELVVEKDAPVVRSNTVEKDSEGGTRTVTQYESGDSTVYLSASGASEPYVVKTLNPRVEGVLVVAEGAGDEGVRVGIAEIVQALYGVETQRVKVVPMETSQG